MADWKERAMAYWTKTTKKQRYATLGGLLVFLTVIVVWGAFYGGKTEYVPLFTNMEAKDAGEVVNKLKELKTPYEIGDKGASILVPSKDVYRLRMELAAQGLPKGKKGFEMFEQSQFGATEFQNKVQYLQALQGELSRTIEQLSEVEAARVHIVLPQDSLYKQNEKPASASIMLKLRSGNELSAAQVKGIVNLTAHSIQGLKPENITVIDQFAKVLNAPDEEGQGPDKKATLTQFQLTKRVQDDLQRNIQSMLDQVIGAHKSAVRVNVELNFDQRSLDRQVFEPVVDDKGIIRSSQDLTENYRGTAAAPGGQPGVASNIPGYVTTNQNQSTYEKKETTRNYEINETKEKIIATPGAIKRLTVAVLIDEGLTQGQQDSISKVVASAAGFNQGRGDVVSVERISFNTDLLDQEKQEQQKLADEAKMLQYAKILLAVLAVVGLAVLWRTHVRRRELAESERVLMATPIGTVAELEEAEALMKEEEKEKEPTPEEKERRKQREEIERLAAQNPDSVAQLIKTWLADE